MIISMRTTLLKSILLLLVCASILAVKEQGDDCVVRYGTEGGFDGVFHYFETPSAGGKCSDDEELFCFTEKDDGKIGKDFPGKCQPKECYKPLDDTVESVTICHRTCSETNPWVRITIDASAWLAHSCGHTTEECTGANLTYWGTNDRDYILKEHGSRSSVASMLGNDANAVTQYWKAWEPACPSVRNGQCCQFDSQYGYTCCGRATIDPMPGDTKAPSTTLSPISSPVSAPTLSPTRSPVSAPTALSPTLSPVNAPSTGPQDLPQEPPQCFYRRLQGDALQERWAINVPEFRYQQSLAFHLDFSISSYISSDKMISYTVMESTCTNSYMGAGLVHSRGLRLPELNGGQKVGVAVWVDPMEISRDTEIYSEGVIDNQMKANVDFCVRFSLHTPPSTAGGAVEVNFIEVIVRFDADLTDGFSIGTLDAAPYDRCEKEANEAFEVEGYFCNDGTEATPIEPDVPTVNQGEPVKVCVRPVQDALDQGVRMRALKEFTWKLQDGDVQQPAIVDYAAADNMLTVMYCTEGYAICHFESILFAAFFARPGAVTGVGIADMQFGGEESDVSVSPKSRRQLRDESRQLQIDQPAEGGSVEFSLDLNLQQAPARSQYSAAAGGRDLRAATLLLVGTTVFAMVSSSTIFLL